LKKLKVILNLLRYPSSCMGILFLLFILACMCSYGQERKVRSIHAPSELFKMIDPERLLNEMRDLASPAFYGRELGTTGNQKATDFLAHKFNQLGLEPIDGSYKQSFPVVSYALGPSNGLTIADSSLEIFNQFVPAYYSDSDSINAKGIFIKFGRNTDLSDVAVQGKIAIIFQDTSLSELPYPTYLHQAELAESFGAEAVILIPTPGTTTPHSPTGSPYRFENNINIPLKGKKVQSNTPLPFVKPETISIPVIFAATDILSLLFDFSQLDNSYEELTPGIHSVHNINLITDIKINTRRQAHNVFGLWRGTERPEKRKTLILGSHFDQQGLHPETGIPFFGANRNAASISVMLEIIKVLSDTDSRPKHNILFAAWNGTERNLAGIHHFVNNPVVDKKNILAVLHLLELAGNIHQKDSSPVSIETLPESFFLTDIVKNSGKLFDFKIDSTRIRNNTYYDYQLYPFANMGIPGISFTGGYYSLSNRIIDSPDKLNYTQMYNMTRYILDITWGLSHVTLTEIE